MGIEGEHAGSRVEPAFLPDLQKDTSITPHTGKWFKQWVPCDTVLNPGKLMLLKWVNDDIMKSLNDKNPEVEKEPEEEFEVLYLCNFEGCGKAFIDQGALKKHIHIHGEKQFICHYEGCGKRFMDSSKLKRHFLTHTGERHFVCRVDGCGKAFSLDFNLRSHMRTHTQENYHVCPFEDCGKRYAHEYKLRAHLRTYHEKVLPPDVKLPPPPPLPHAFEKEIKVQKMATSGSSPANPARPFVCPHEGCDKRYIHEYKLNLHLRKEHANDAPPEARRAAARQHADGDDVDDGRGRGKIRFTPSKASMTHTVVKRKYPNQAPLEVYPKMQRAMARQEEVAQSNYYANSDEESEEEDAGDTEDEDMRGMGHGSMQYDDEEETEDDMD